jgi:hypothetical protein
VQTIHNLPSAPTQEADTKYNGALGSRRSLPVLTVVRLDADDAIVAPPSIGMPRFRTNQVAKRAHSNGKGNCGTVVRATWLDTCILSDSKKPKPLPVLANVLAFLREVMPDHFAFDEMLQVPKVMRALTEDKSDFKLRPCTDVDVGSVQEILQRQGLKSVTRDTVHRATRLAVDDFGRLRPEPSMLKL